MYVDGMFGGSWRAEGRSDSVEPYGASLVPKREIPQIASERELNGRTDISTDSIKNLLIFNLDTAEIAPDHAPIVTATHLTHADASESESTVVFQSLRNTDSHGRRYLHLKRPHSTPHYWIRSAYIQYAYVARSCHRLWKVPNFSPPYHGRVDDLLVFASGEKFHPASVEKHITGHPEVESTLLVGDQRPQAALLIAMNTGESLYSAEERSKAISRLWPTIIESNETCPVYAKLTKSHILFAHAQKPMVKTGKGAVQRSATIGLYEEELDRLFARASEPSASATASAHTLITDS